MTSVSNGAAAAAAMDAQSVDVLVLEYGLANDAATKLLARARSAGVPCIFTTDRPEVIDRLDVPPAQYLRKPVVVKELVAILLDYLMD